MKRVAVIIVTHNSQSVLPLCLASLETQTLKPKCIVIVDSGSADTGYLQQCCDVARIKVLFEKNIGFRSSLIKPRQAFQLPRRSGQPGHQACSMG